MFTDINLPDGPDAIDGLELARKAVELCRGLRVIYTTGHGQTDGMTALFVADATFLPKPYTVKQLTIVPMGRRRTPARVAEAIARTKLNSLIGISAKQPVRSRSVAPPFSMRPPVPSDRDR
jgi:two-component SAPR family response regulator